MSRSEFRKLLHKQQSKQSNTQQSPSKLCEFDMKLGKWKCKLCKIPLKSVNHWSLHSKSETHNHSITELRNKLLNKTKNTEMKDTHLSTVKNIEIEDQTSKEEEMVDDSNCLPMDFFDIPQKKNKNIKHEEKQNADESHFLIIEQHSTAKTDIQQKNNEQNMDDTQETLLKLDVEYQQMREKKEENESLQFRAEIASKWEEEQSSETKQELQYLEKYRMKFEQKKNENKRKYDEIIDGNVNDDDNIPPKKKSKLQETFDSDSDFNEDDFFDLTDWRTKKV